MDYGTNMDYARANAVGVSTSGSDIFAVIAIMLAVLLLLALAAYVIYSIFLSKIFKKASLPAWQAWVPFLNAWRTLELGGKKGYWIALGIGSSIGLTISRNIDNDNALAISSVFSIISIGLGIAYFVINLIALHNINLKMQYGAGMTVCAVFLPIVWVIVLGVSKNQWNDSLGDPRVNRPAAIPAYPQAAPMANGGVAQGQPQPPVQPVPPVQTQAPTPDQNNSQPHQQ